MKELLLKNFKIMDTTTRPFTPIATVPSEEPQPLIQSSLARSIDELRRGWFLHNETAILEPEPEYECPFSEGDIIIANAKAPYLYTKEGVKCEVIKVSKSSYKDITVRMLSNKTSKFEVYSKYFTLVEKAKPLILKTGLKLKNKFNPEKIFTVESYYGIYEYDKKEFKDAQNGFLPIEGGWRNKMNYEICE